MPTIYVQSKNMKIVKKTPENCHFYSREILQYIARTCLRNVKCTFHEKSSFQTLQPGNIQISLCSYRSLILDRNVIEYAS